MRHIIWGLVSLLMILNVSGSDAGNTGDFPRLNAKPWLRGPIVENNDFRFDCVIDYNRTDRRTPDAVYEISLLVDGTDSGIPPTQLTYPDKSVSYSSEKLEGHLGKTLECKVHTFWVTEPVILSPQEISNAYWIGIKLSHKAIKVSESDKSSTGGPPLVGRVYVYSTVPILCSSGSDPCRLELQVESPTMILSGQTGTPLCQLWLDASDYHNSGNPFVEERALQVRPKRTPSQRAATIHFTIKPGSSAFNPSWMAYNPESIDVALFGDIKSLGQCSIAQGRYTTFDGVRHDMLSTGIFTVVQSPANNVYVQAKFHESSPTNIYGAICGIVVMSVAADGMFEQEKHIIERCNEDLGGVPTGEPIKIFRCQEKETNPITIIGNEYTITTATGDLQVVMVDMNTYFNVYIDVLGDATTYATMGTCGNYDNNQNNEHAGSYDTSQPPPPYVPCPSIESTCFEEWARVSEEESYFICQNEYYPPSPCEAIEVTMTTFDTHSYTSTDQGIYNMVTDVYDNRFIEMNRTSSGTCGVAVRSGTIPTSEGHRGEIIVIDKCHGTLSIMKCQNEQTYPVVNNAAGVYTITTVDGIMKVQIQDMGAYIDVSTDDIWDVTPMYPPGGLCGNNDANPDNEYQNLEEFMESNRVDPNDALLNCTQYYPADVTTV